MASGKKRAYLALVALCMSALFVDRIVLTKGGGGPSRAEGSPAVGPTGGKLAESLESQPIPTIAFPVVPPEAEERPPRDFFAPPGTLASVQQPGLAPNRGRASRIGFAETARLAGVMLTSDGGIAVVNGTRMMPGDTLLGCRLENVFGRSARFRCSDGVAVLFIAPRGSKAAN